MNFFLNKKLINDSIKKKHIENFKKINLNNVEKNNKFIYLLNFIVENSI